jgi:N-acetylglucosamine-6-phosphate deacetylase
MHQLFTAASVITPDETLTPGWVLVRDGVIEAAGKDNPPQEAVDRIDLPDHTLVPGFVDIHVHGGGGYSLISGDMEEARACARWVTRTGVTSFLPTVCASTPGDAVPILRTLASLATENVGGAEVLGVNLEGPFVSPDRRGALPPSWVHAPDESVFRSLLEAAGGNMRLITCAPEVEGATALVSATVAAGVAVSVGHTDADFDGASAGFKAGATHVTHALNAMRPFHHRDPGVIGAALEAQHVTIEAIGDGVHLHPAAVRMLIRSFGPARVALVTDAVTPAGLDAGTFRIGDADAILRAGRITLEDGTIAGSAATMDMVVRNVVSWRAATLPEAVSMASAVPAKVAGAGDRKGRIASGYDADLVALTDDLKVSATWIKGLRPGL